MVLLCKAASSASRTPHSSSTDKRPHRGGMAARALERQHGPGRRMSCTVFHTRNSEDGSGPNILDQALRLEVPAYAKSTVSARTTVLLSCSRLASYALSGLLSPCLLLLTCPSHPISIAQEASPSVCQPPVISAAVICPPRLCLVFSRLYY